MTEVSGAWDIALPVRRRREELGLSRERLAQLVGVSTSTLERVELYGHIPRADRLAAILAALNTTIDELRRDTPRGKAEVA